MLEKSFSPAEAEARLYAIWESSGAFAADPTSDAEPFTIMIPPPNVTGALHMGHALNNHAAGHAGPLRADARPRRAVAARHRPCRHRDPDGGRAPADAERQRAGSATWAARHSSSGSGSGRPNRGGAIINQLQPARRLAATGRASASPWTRACRAPCVKVFVELHREGLIYQRQAAGELGPEAADRDLRPRGASSREVKGSLWHIRYPIEGELPDRLHHRRDHAAGDHAGRHRGRGASRRRALSAIWSASTSILPLVGRRIPIVADEYADPEKGTGAVKITPAHDFNDFEVGKRHDLPHAIVLDREGARHARRERGLSARRAEGVADPLRRARSHGIDRFAARKRDRGASWSGSACSSKIEPHTHRCRMATAPACVIEPLADRPVVLSTPTTLAKPAIAAVRDGRDRVRAEALGKDLSSTGCENIQPWCISASSGGAIGSRPGTGRTARSSSPTTEAEAPRPPRATHYGDATSALTPGRGRARHLVLLGAVAVLDAGLAGADAGAGALLPDRRAGHRLRHHLLLGRPDDDDGPALHGRGAVPHRLHPRPGARREGRRRCRSRRATSSIRWS